MARRNGETKKEWLAKEVAKAVNAGKAWDCETVDFAEPGRPPTCLEVDFPILPINAISSIESTSGAAKKPIYQMSKWWARRQSSIFRSMLLAAAMKAPSDRSESAKIVWDAYYGNHQKKGSFKHLKVADIFMGGGTTVVEGSRLGMQMYGNDLNPVAWFVVKNEMAKVEKAEVEALLADIEREVKPQIMPFYACDCPRGHKGKWTKISTGEVMGDDFAPASLSPEECKDYSYEGPEIIYVFWAKHGPCQVTGCGHRTPIMTSPVMAVKTISVKYWVHKCPHCSGEYDLEELEARMAPGVPLVVADTERPFTIFHENIKFGSEGEAICPICGKESTVRRRGKPKKKKVELTLLVHPEWLQGESGHDADGREYGGRSDDPVEATIRWNQVRAAKCRLVEVRGKLSDEVTCPETGVTFKTGKDGGTISKKSYFECQSCGKSQEVLSAVSAGNDTAPFAEYAYQVLCPECQGNGDALRGRYFVPAKHPELFNKAVQEWRNRKSKDLSTWWPREALAPGWKTHGAAMPEHGYTHYYKMFTERQLLSHALLLKSIETNDYTDDIKDFILGGFQQFLRCCCFFTIWHKTNNQISAFFSNNYYYINNNVVETKAFSPVGDGSWFSSIKGLSECIEWNGDPWERVTIDYLNHIIPEIATELGGQTAKVYPCDVPRECKVTCFSSNDLKGIKNGSYDLIITDPPFGEIMQYSELSDFFYVWLKIALSSRYSDLFSSEYTPKSLEAVANPHRNDMPHQFYKRILTECWHEAYRIMKPTAILAFTFHHDKDGPWVDVLESLFDAGLYLVATYPIRGDTSKGKDKVSFGAEKVEFDIIHVCRKRMEDPQPISWAKMRRQVLQDVRRLQEMLEHHQEEGLPEADLQVIRRGKALEYFSRHYGKVYKDEGVPINVLEALVGINQLLDE
ncbi:MAG: DUF1156 domain-containing protein, partial [Thermodesulfobacteriota bacterium]|nr:DUF1156 domain-containing protein [Thermodesulfobacteriota bacterium]